MSLRVSFNGRTLASQANNVGSIPITRSNFFAPSKKALQGAFGISPSTIRTASDFQRGVLR